MQNRLKELRHEKNLTLRELGEKVGMRNSTLSQYETNKREPKLKTWQKLADFWEVSVPYLQGLDQEWYQAECLECGKVFRILPKEADAVNCCPFCKEFYLSISKAN